MLFKETTVEPYNYFLSNNELLNFNATRIDELVVKNVSSKYFLNNGRHLRRITKSAHLKAVVKEK